MTTVISFSLLAIIATLSWTDGYRPTTMVPTQTTADAITTEGFENTTPPFSTEISDVLDSATGNVKDEVKLVEEAATTDAAHTTEIIFDIKDADSGTTIFFKPHTMNEHGHHTIIAHPPRPISLEESNWKREEFLLRLLLVTCLLMISGSWAYGVYSNYRALGPPCIGTILFRIVAYFRRRGGNDRGSHGEEIELGTRANWSEGSVEYLPSHLHAKNLEEVHKPYKYSKTTLAEDGPVVQNGGTSPPSFSSDPLLDDFQLDFKLAEPLPSTSNTLESAFLVPISKKPSANGFIPLLPKGTKPPAPKPPLKMTAYNITEF